MAKRKKKRTSIRTAAGTAQKLYLERVRALRDDPLRVLPECTDGTPKPLAKVEKRLNKLRDGKAGFLDRRDRGVVGAVANILDVADQTAVPRLADHKVAGKRRFYLQRGDVERQCSIGVQNHDEPLALVLAWRPMAKKHGLHFFASDRVWCTGPKPTPPPEWIDALSRDDEVTLGPEDQDYGCGHQGTGRVVLGLRGGPSIAICKACARRTGNLHGRLAARYVGPRLRQPVEVWFEAPDGQRMEWDPKQVAAYRAGTTSERDLIREATDRWRQATPTAGPRFVLGERDFQDDQEAFLDALDIEPWERQALAVMTRDGHQGRRDAVEAVLRRNKTRLPDGLAAIADTDLVDRLLSQPTSDLRGVLREAHEQQERRIKTAALPRVHASGPIGRLLDDAARAHLTEGPRGAIAVATQSPAAGWMRCAVVLACNGDPDLDGGFNADEKGAAEPWVERLQQLFASEGDDYTQRLREAVEASGTGEAVEAA